jgi:Arc/MetJ-type ribon-helix-helix transcriptional regulator
MVIGMKLSVSLPDDDVAFLDAFTRAQGGSRSAVLHRAVGLLREAELGAAYAEAWAEWEGSEDAAVWDTTAGDGLGA